MSDYFGRLFYTGHPGSTDVVSVPTTKALYSVGNGLDGHDGELTSAAGLTSTGHVARGDISANNADALRTANSSYGLSDNDVNGSFTNAGHSQAHNINNYDTNTISSGTAAQSNPNAFIGSDASQSSGVANTFRGGENVNHSDWLSRLQDSGPDPLSNMNRIEFPSVWTDFR